jgi:hypothetical protein
MATFTGDGMLRPHQKFFKKRFAFSPDAVRKMGCSDLF